VTIRQLPQRPNYMPGDPKRLWIVGRGFPTEDGAKDCGNRLKQALLILGCQERVGVDVGRDRATTSWGQAVIDNVRKQEGKQLRDSVHGLDVFCDDVALTHMDICGTGVAGYIVDQFQERVAGEFTATGTLTPKLRLALELYNLSRFEPASKARFLALITIIEVLAERERRDPAVIQEVEKLKKIFKIIKPEKLVKPYDEVILNALGEMKREKIGEACRRVVEKHAGAEAASHFKECYDVRSMLLHEGETDRPELMDSQELENTVQKVLLSMVRSDAPTEDAAPSQS
jgi:hypothetical protein